MAVIPATYPTMGRTLDYKDVHVAQWLLVSSADTCSAVELPRFADRSVQIAGTFGGATVEIHGSIDGTNYKVLTDPQGNDISKALASIECITELVRYIKPVFTGGGGTQSITVSIIFRE